MGAGRLTDSCRSRVVGGGVWLTEACRKDEGLCPPPGTGLRPIGLEVVSSLVESKFIVTVRDTGTIGCSSCAETSCWSTCC